MYIDKMRVPKALDRRRKLSDEDKQDIRFRFFTGHQAVHAIAREYADKCCRRTIQFVLFPNRREQMASQHDSTKYYSKEKRREEMKRHREYKNQIKNQLLEKTEEQPRKKYL